MSVRFFSERNSTHNKRNLELLPSPDAVLGGRWKDLGNLDLNRARVLQRPQKPTSFYFQNTSSRSQPDTALGGRKKGAANCVNQPRRLPP